LLCIFLHFFITSSAVLLCCLKCVCVCVILFWRSHYTQRRFGLIYTEVMKKSPHVHRTRSYFNHCCGNTDVPLNSPPETHQMETALFDYPFNELFVSVCFKFAEREHYMAFSLSSTLWYSQWFLTFLGRGWKDNNTGLNSNNHSKGVRCS
jgi:hypothetical protein